jgi:hypothetical protein
VNARKAVGGTAILGVALAASVAGIAGAAAAPAAWSPARVYHQPPWLLARGRPARLAYGFVDRGVAVYVRNDLRRDFTRLPLARSPRSGMWVAQVPAKLVAGTRLSYYAVLRDPASGRPVTVPARGALAPQRVWVVDPAAVSLGTHRFGRLRAPDAIVARASAAQAGFSCCADPPGGDGPSSFDVAGDGSIWVLDRLSHRLLVWAPGHPAKAARTVRLPRNLSLADFALGRDGTIFARGVDTAELGRGSKEHLYALTPGGRVRWRAPATSGVPTAQLQLGPDGGLSSAQACGEACAPFGGGNTWTALTTASGAPLSQAGRAARTSAFQPLPGGLRLVTSLQTRWSTAAGDLEPAGEVRYALVDRRGRVVRAWSVTSRTRLALGRSAPALVGGDLVVPLEVSGRSGSRLLWEDVILRLAGRGAPRSFSVAADTVLGDVDPFDAVRVGPDGALYQLRTDPRAGVTVARYSLGA